MILSASRRTDIPCHYPEWLMNRIRAGYVLTRNPMNHARLSRIPLTPDDVDCIVFWTKDPAPLLPWLDELDARGYRYYFQFTLTPYDRTVEHNLRPKAEIEETFRRLSRRLGRHRVVWRYDPILMTDVLDPAYHKAQFSRLCASLADYTDTVVFSFVDPYARRNNPPYRVPTSAEEEDLAAFIGKTAAESGLKAAACCEAGDYSRFGIGRSACIDPARIMKICGSGLCLKPDRNQRPGCTCVQSVDIGSYDTCHSGCAYCYATHSPASVARRWEKYDPAGEMLCDEPDGSERITERKTNSAKQGQLTLF